MFSYKFENDKINFIELNYIITYPSFQCFTNSSAHFFFYETSWTFFYKDHYVCFVLEKSILLDKLHFSNNLM